MEVGVEGTQQDKGEDMQEETRDGIISTAEKLIHTPNWKNLLHLRCLRYKSMKEMSDYSVLGAEDDNEIIPTLVGSTSKIQRNLRESIDGHKDHLEVFLRIKPVTKDATEQENDQKYLDVESDKAVVVRPLWEAVAPPPSFAGGGMGCAGPRTCQHGMDNTPRLQNVGSFPITRQQSLKFTFSRVFDETTNQKFFFDETVQSTVREFLDGQNCLLFAYGVTNSGKTHTMQGTPSDAGVIPRTFDVIFNSVGDRLYGKSDLKPSRFCDVELLDEEAESREMSLKESILRQIDIQQKGNVMNEKIMASRTREQTSLAVKEAHRVRFTLWASFAGLHNEQVYDLLIPPPEETRLRRLKIRTGTYRQGRTTAAGQSRNVKERDSLQLKEDVQGRPYINGLREVNITSADEALMLFLQGRINLQISYTKLNESLSRSHCIFTLKLMRVLESENCTEIKHTKFNIFSLCDLAGIDRICKIQNVGEKVKEAGNINNSLLTLGRCIEAMRHNQLSQASDRQLLPPFRDSKLTRLFQPFLIGKGRVKMVVTVNQCRSTYPENLNAIKFSAIAKQVSISPAQLNTLNVSQPTQPQLPKKLEPRSNSQNEKDGKIKFLEEENIELRQKVLCLEERIEKMKRETQILVKSQDGSEVMDKKVTHVDQKTLKRRKFDNDDDDLRNLESRDEMKARIKDLEEDLQMWKRNYDLSVREVKALTREVTELKFKAAIEKMKALEVAANVKEQVRLREEFEQSQAANLKEYNTKIDRIEKRVIDLPLFVSTSLPSAVATTGRRRHFVRIDNTHLANIQNPREENLSQL